MLPQNNPDRIRILFDDHRLVANAGLLLPATLARHLGLRELVDHHLDLGGAPGRANTGDKMLTLVASALAGGDCIDLGGAPGRANTGDKMLTLVASALAGGDCIDDADALRAGGTVGVLGCVVKASSTLGTFLRSFRWGDGSPARRAASLCISPGAGLGKPSSVAPWPGCKPFHVRQLDRVSRQSQLPHRALGALCGD